MWKHGRTLGETKGPLQTGHFVLELVKLPPPRGEEERPGKKTLFNSIFTVEYNNKFTQNRHRTHSLIIHGVSFEIKY